jgi:hypothetical protein
MKLVSFCYGLVILTQTMVFAQSNPVPFVNQVLDPVSVQPGGKEFLLTVNGTGFASTAAINWNGSPILTNVDSANRVTAKISAAKIRKAGTASITVTNPAPGGGTSNVVYLPIRQLFSTVAMSSSSPTCCTALTVGDFNNDGKLDIATGSDNPNQGVYVWLGNGDGTFQNLIATSSPFYHQYAMLAADFNGDGRLDLAVSDGNSNIGTFLGNGDGTFSQPEPFGSVDGPNFLAAGDFNGDGKLDLYVGGEYPGYNTPAQFEIYLGNGDGTFQATQPVDAPGNGGSAGIGDFNGDGFLDLALGNGAGSVNIFLGNGDGTFRPPVSYQAGYGGVSVTAADMNGDGKLDLVTYSQNGVAILLGKGDGTFTLAGNVEFAEYIQLYNDLKVGDFNGDGFPDVAVFYLPIETPPDEVVLFLGNGDGTLQGPLPFASLQFETDGLGFGMGDFNGDGLLDLVTNDGTLHLQMPVTASPSSLEFGDQILGTTSAAQTVTFTNLKPSALKIDGIGIGGTDSSDFSETNNCGTSLPAHGSCQIQVTFSPQAIGDRYASLNVAYAGTGSPLTVPLHGTGVTATVSLAPIKLGFATQLVGTASSPQPATLANTGTGPVNISSISTKGPFTQTNDCPSSLPAGANCDILVRFAPHAEGAAKGMLSVSDDATGSPQTVSLSGVGTVVTFSPLGVNFGDQKVGTSSPPVPIELFNKGGTTLSITQITLSGKNSGDLRQKNNCGQSVPAHGHCTISVTFTPTATGQRSGAVSITDDGGGSPQSVPLAGTGT